jgi:hypothetical protein
MLRFRRTKSWLLLFGLLVCIGNTHFIQAEGEPQLVVRGVVWQMAPAPQVAPSLVSLYRQQLPMVVTSGVPATIAFFGRTGDLRSGPANQFGYGITALEYEIQIVGAAGLPYREEWSVDGQSKPQLGSQGTIPASTATLTNALLYSTGAPLPRGTYRLRFFIAEYVAADTSVVVR